MPFRIIGDLHDRVDKGELFTAFYTDESVSDNDSILLRANANSLYLNYLISIETAGMWRFESFLDTTYTNDGTQITPIQRRTDSKNIISSSFYNTPTIDVLGDSRFDYIFGYGERPSRTSNSQFSDDIISKFAPNSDILVRLTNLSGSTQYISAIINAYETKE